MTQKNKILAEAKAQRVQEVFTYQINIDNYERAIVRIDACGDADLVEFRAQIAALLVTEKLEQKKASIMLAVICEQLEESHV